MANTNAYVPGAPPRMNSERRAMVVESIRDKVARVVDMAKKGDNVGADVYASDVTFLLRVVDRIEANSPAICPCCGSVVEGALQYADHYEDCPLGAVYQPTRGGLVDLPWRSIEGKAGRVHSSVEAAVEADRERMAELQAANLDDLVRKPDTTHVGRYAHKYGGGRSGGSGSRSRSSQYAYSGEGMEGEEYGYATGAVEPEPSKYREFRQGSQLYRLLNDTDLEALAQQAVDMAADGWSIYRQTDNDDGTRSVIMVKG